MQILAKVLNTHHNFCPQGIFIALDFIKNNYPKNLDELQIALNKFVYYNNNIKIKKKLKTTAINYRCSHS